MKDSVLGQAGDTVVYFSRDVIAITSENSALIPGQVHTAEHEHELTKRLHRYIAKGRAAQTAYATHA